MSLAKLKAKEYKGKQKSLPKLKAILANPDKKKCPILDESEMKRLKNLLQTTIEESKLEPIRFATEKGICLGLESSLRKINNQGSSCVFISLSIKPNHIVGLIARNAETKDETQPVYAQPKLENFVEEIFGIQALCMVFPKDLLAIGDKIDKWVQERRKRTKIKKIEGEIQKNFKKKIKKKQIPNEMDAKENKLISEKVAKNSTGDFISFAKDTHGADNSKLEDSKAVDALSKIMDKIPTSTTAMRKLMQKTEAMDVDDEAGRSINVMSESEESDVSDYFLGQYKTLTVHKIKANPNKKPKKKRIKKGKRPKK